MKNFFEEYGFVILTAIVLLILIIMCTPIGNSVRAQIFNFIDSFSEKETTKNVEINRVGDTATLDYNNGKITLKIQTGSQTNVFIYQVLYTKNKKVSQSETRTSGTLKLADTEDYYYINIDIPEKGDAGTTVQIKLKNTGTNEIFYSNKITIPTK